MTISTLAARLVAATLLSQGRPAGPIPTTYGDPLYPYGAGLQAWP